MVRLYDELKTPSSHFTAFEWTLFASAHFQSRGTESSVLAWCISLCIFVWHQRVSVSRPRHACNSSFISSQKEVRHILINYKGDAAGRSDAYHIGDDSFVKTNGAFVPGEKVTKQWPWTKQPHLETRTQTAREQISITPPCPSDDINNSFVSIVLVLQASSHHLIRVRCGHSKYFGQRSHHDIFQCILFRQRQGSMREWEMSTAEKEN